MGTRQLYVVLTRSGTILSGLIHRVTKDEFTHAALSLDRDLEYMFSFGRRYTNNPFVGCFRRENLNEGLYAKHSVLPGLILEITVTRSEYEQAAGMIEDFWVNNHCYGYNYAGLMNGLFGFKSGAQNRFLCSEFVYYVLYNCGLCDLGLPRSLIRPQDLLNIGASITYEGNLKRYNKALLETDLALHGLKFAG